MTSATRVRLTQHLIPKNLVSAVIYRVARSEIGWLKKPLIEWFARAYRVDMTEAEEQNLASYPTFNAFFTRALKAGARPLAGDEDTVIAPADGVVTEFGTIEEGRLLQAKGRHYDLAALLGEEAPDLAGGEFLTIYLAPHNYHRVHMPLGATLTRTRYLPGERFSVSVATAAVIDRLFCRNERVVCRFESAHGPMAVVLVGALNVSSISTINRGEIVSGNAQHWVEDPPLELARGGELGRFNMGSTVVLLFGPGVVRWDTQLSPGTAIMMGRALGRAVGR
jgi:phosphatidylserine decarboxylase